LLPLCRTRPPLVYQYRLASTVREESRLQSPADQRQQPAPGSVQPFKGSAHDRRNCSEWFPPSRRRRMSSLPSEVVKDTAGLDTKAAPPDRATVSAPNPLLLNRCAEACIACPRVSRIGQAPRQIISASIVLVLSGAWAASALVRKTHLRQKVMPLNAIRQATFSNPSAVGKWWP